MQIKFGEITIGEGIPKIAIPIIDAKEEDILRRAERIAESPAEIAEWRVDFYEKRGDGAAVREMIARLRSMLKGKLLLFTCRTVREGGNAECAEYRAIVQNSIFEKGADLIDVELSAGDDFVAEMAESMHRNGSFTVVSYHNFTETPSAEFLEEKYLAMKDTGADILKIAVMPRNREDVERMMNVSRKISKNIDCPIISISMGELGKALRIFGEVSGSCITFGTLGVASAPGQLDCSDLKDMLRAAHANSELLQTLATTEEMGKILDIS